MPTQETNGDQPSTRRPRELDPVDRKILGLLAQNADRSFAELGELLNLSPPAVHERVKRMKRNGTIRRTVAMLDPDKVGRDLLAFVHLETSNWETTRQVLDMASLDAIEEIHTVAGDTAMILKVRTASTGALEEFLSGLHQMDGFKRVKTFVVLGTYQERGTLP
ncbi:transcriptional regulator, AsnC family [Sphingopyxis sp. YR583]|nr:transcriptional regulator, AsnC family [Sphingopyxis sp. YR583]